MVDAEGCKLNAVAETRAAFATKYDSFILLKPTYEAIHHPNAQPFLVQINPRMEHSSKPMQRYSDSDPKIKAWKH